MELKIPSKIKFENFTFTCCCNITANASIHIQISVSTSTQVVKAIANIRKSSNFDIVGDTDSYTNTGSQNILPIKYIAVVESREANIGRLLMMPRLLLLMQWIEFSPGCIFIQGVFILFKSDRYYFSSSIGMAQLFLLYIDFCIFGSRFARSTSNWYSASVQKARYGDKILNIFKLEITISIFICINKISSLLIDLELTSNHRPEEKVI